MRWILWWCAVLALYEAASLVSDWTEIAAGIIVTSIALVIGIAAYRSAPRDARVALPVLRHLAAVPTRMIRDAVTVLVRIVRSLRAGDELAGYFVRVPYEPATGDAFDQGREAISIYGICAAPNTIVADVDERGALVVHNLFASDDAVQTRRWPV